MKNLFVVFALVLSGCGSMPLPQRPEVSESACTASCNAHFDQCPQIFAGFPERGAVECPAEHNNCLKTCKTHRAAARAPATPSVVAPSDAAATQGANSPPQTGSGTVRTGSSREERLRELKHLHDEGLVSDDVYRDRQKAILSEL
jgi:hypothetical protein